jgi:general secretion pathway protein H
VDGQGNKLTPPRARRRSRRRRSDSGFTLLEVLVVMAVIALVLVSGVRGIRSLANSDLRAASTRMAGAIRYLFDRASATGRIHRLVIDFDEQKFWAEMSEDRFLIARDRETAESREREAEEIAKEEEEEKRLEENKKTGMVQSQYDISAYQPQEFKPKRAHFAAFKEVAVKPVTLKGKAKIASLYTPRLAEPLSSGRGYIYFFPLGQTEPALVHLTDMSDRKFYSLVVHPLTGRVQVQNEYIEPPIDERFDDEGQRLEP